MQFLAFTKEMKNYGDIAIGDSEYVPVCRECYNELVQKYKNTNENKK